MCKKAVTASAMEVLPSGFMNTADFESFRHDSLMYQMRIPGAAVARRKSLPTDPLSIDSLFEAAEAAFPYFKEIMVEIVRDVGFDPDDEACFRGERASHSLITQHCTVLHHTTPRRAHTTWR